MIILDYLVAQCNQKFPYRRKAMGDLMTQEEQG